MIREKIAKAAIYSADKKRTLLNLEETMVDLFANPSNQRLHDRFDFDAKLAELTLADFGRCTVADLSYGGLGAIIDDSKAKVDQSKRLEGVINVLGIEWRVSLEPVYLAEGKLGCRFVHSDESGLLKLREIIEPLRIGQSAFELNKQKLKAEFHGKQWRVFHGDGPVLIHLKHTDETCSELAELSMTMRPYNYSIIEYKDGKVFMGGMQEFTAGLKSASMAVDPAVRPQEIFRTAYMILGSIPDEKAQENLAPVLNSLLPLIPGVKAKIKG